MTPITTMFRLQRFTVPVAGCTRIRQFSSCQNLLSGHSKWQTIKRDKAKNDQQRADVAFKIAQQITILVRLGGPEPDGNPLLLNCLEKLKKMSVTKKVIEGAIKRASGQVGAKDNVETVTYEGMGPQGVAVIVELLTDNKSRTIGFVKPCFTKAGGQLSPTAFMFDKKGFITIDREGKEFDEIFEDVLETGAEDMEELPVDLEENPDGKLVEIITDPAETGLVHSKLKELGYKVTDMSIGYKPKEDMMVELQEEQRQAVDKFLAKLDEVNDVSYVYTNIRD